MTSVTSFWQTMIAAFDPRSDGQMSVAAPVQDA
jgi:hypothetical protein